MEIYIHTDIFEKWSGRVQDISKHVNPLKTGCLKFLQTQYFLLMYIEENKNKTTQIKNLKVSYGTNYNYFIKFFYETH